MTNKSTHYKYYYRNARGPGYAHQPDGFDPDTRSAEVKPRDTPLGERVFYGGVQYPNPLTMHEVWRFELMPADKVEWAKYLAWESFREDGSLWVIEDYAKIINDLERADDAEKLKQLLPGIIAIILADAGVDIAALELKYKNELALTA